MAEDNFEEIFPETEETIETVEAEAEKPEPVVEEPVKEEVVAEVPAAEPTTVPLAALQEERAKRQQLESMLQSQEPVKAEPAPDMFEKPAEYTEYMQRQNQIAVQTVKLDLSEDMARTQHGDAVVDAAFAAAQAAGPQVVSGFINKRNPYGELVKWHQQQTIATEIGDPIAYKEKLRAELLAEISAEQVAKQAGELATKASPSLAGGTNVGTRTAGEWGGPASLGDLLPD